MRILGPWIGSVLSRILPDSIMQLLVYAAILFAALLLVSWLKEKLSGSSTSPSTAPAAPVNVSSPSAVGNVSTQVEPITEAAAAPKAVELPRTSVPIGVSDKLAKLKAALDMGILTEQEFEQKRAMLERGCSGAQ